MQVGRQVGRHVGRQVSRKVGSQKSRQVGRQIGRQIGRQVNRQVGRQEGRQAEINETCTQVDICIFHCVICSQLLLLCFPKVISINTFLNDQINIFYCKHLRYQFCAWIMSAFNINLLPLSNKHFIIIIKQIHFKGCYLNSFPFQHSYASNSDT